LGSEVALLTKNVTSGSLESTDLLSDESDTSSEGFVYSFESEADTDDEVEEANRSDDMIKIIEGDC
jgi:hypothetical protein